MYVATVPNRNSPPAIRSEEHTSELQSCNLVCRLLLEKKKQTSYCNAAASVDAGAQVPAGRAAPPGGASISTGKIPGPSCPFFFNDTATTEIYTLSLHDALPI